MQDLLARSLLDMLLIALGWLAPRLATRILRGRMPRAPRAAAADCQRAACLIDSRLVPENRDQMEHPLGTCPPPTINPVRPGCPPGRPWPR